MVSFAADHAQDLGSAAAAAVDGAVGHYLSDGGIGGDPSDRRSETAKDIG